MKWMMLFFSYFNFSCKVISKTQQQLSICCWIFRDFACNDEPATSKGFHHSCSLLVVERNVTKSRKSQEELSHCSKAGKCQQGCTWIGAMQIRHYW